MVALAPLTVNVAFAQIVADGPALAVAEGVIVRTRVLVTLPEQGATGYAVRVRVAPPLRISRALGVYTVASCVAFEKVPVPLDDQSVDAAWVTLAPIVRKVLPWQMRPAGPAMTTGFDCMVRVCWLVTVLVQGNMPVALRVKMTGPAVISAALGV